MCDHEWHAVFPEGVLELECPSCHCMMPLATYRVDLIGPFRGDIHYISISGYRLNNVHARRHEKGKDLWAVVLDGRFEIDVTAIELCHWAGFLGDAMAIAAGYTCHGENCMPLNRYKTLFTGLKS
ncbi:hypothetical protein LCGC14_1849660 [marine sediment metagenome]|uniref:Uncharacterized protein n=1 Tax=marine sediment metagenome TaxID=412755 RepID=A0A0F9IQ94_9ZZZZ